MRYPFTEEDSRRILEVADFVTEYMKKAGVVVQRYDALSTLSVYLKFDYGICNSMRISDHRGKDNLTYKYNVRTDVEAYYSNGEGATEHNFFPIDQAEAACRLILINRFRKIGRYGFEWYQRTMSEQPSLKAFQKNCFWQSASICK
jgi:hypothetical protein